MVWPRRTERGEQGGGSDCAKAAACAAKREACEHVHSIMWKPSKWMRLPSSTSWMKRKTKTRMTQAVGLRPEAMQVLAPSLVEQPSIAPTVHVCMCVIGVFVER